MKNELESSKGMLPDTWYRRGECATERLVWEREKMLELFDILHPNKIELPNCGWDRKYFTLITKKVELTNNHDLEKTGFLNTEIDQKRFGLAWYIEFIMADSNHLPKTDRVWQMMAAYPPDIETPGRHIFYRNLPRKNLHTGARPVHILTAHDLENGYKCCRICYFEHDKPSRFLDPHLPMSEHALEGIKWLRAYLYRRKVDLSDMPLYKEDYGRS